MVATYYLDTSVLAKRYLREAGTDFIRRLFRQANTVWLSSRITDIEIHSAMLRRLKERTISQAFYENAPNYYEIHASRTIQFIEVTPSLAARAKAVIAKHRLRTLDAIHLATALIISEPLLKLPAVSFILLSADSELKEAAKAENLRVLDPTAEMDSFNKPRI